MSEEAVNNRLAELSGKYIVWAEYDPKTDRWKIDLMSKTVDERHKQDNLTHQEALDLMENL